MRGGSAYDPSRAYANTTLLTHARQTRVNTHTHTYLVQLVFLVPHIVLVVLVLLLLVVLLLQIQIVPRAGQNLATRNHLARNRGRRRDGRAGRERVADDGQR